MGTRMMKKMHPAFAAGLIFVLGITVSLLLTACARTAREPDPNQDAAGQSQGAEGSDTGGEGGAADGGGETDAAGEEDGSDSAARDETEPAGHPSWRDDAHPNLTEHEDGVSVTFPAEMFAQTELSREFIEANDYIDARKNSDGSVVITMSNARHLRFLDAYKDTIDYNIDYFKQNLDYLRDIRYAADFRSMDIYVGGETDRELLKELPYFFSKPFEEYQQMLGWEAGTTFRVIDGATGESIMTLVFPDVETNPGQAAGIEAGPMK